MHEHDVLSLIKKADTAISSEDFDALMDFYADDAVLVVQRTNVGQFLPLRHVVRLLTHNCHRGDKHRDDTFSLVGGRDSQGWTRRQKAPDHGGCEILFGIDRSQVSSASMVAIRNVSLAALYAGRE